MTIDVAARRGERRIAFATLLILPFAVWAWDPAGAGLASAGVLLVAAVAYGFVALGWIGGRTRLTRIACRADGRWVLYEAGGRVVEAELTTASRMSPHALWLCWDARRLKPLLLIRGDISDSDLRRLLVRLRVAPFRTRDGHEIAM